MSVNLGKCCEMNLLIIRGSGFLTRCEIDKAIDKLLKQLKKWNLDSGKVGILFDLQLVLGIDMASFERIAKFMDNFSQLAKEKVRLSVIVITDQIVEKLIQLLFKLRKPVTPVKIVNSLEQACKLLNY